MKTLNFWRTLLFTVTAAAAFAACSNDDEPGGSSGEPKITVNGQDAATITLNALTAGTTAAVEVQSSGTWTWAFNTTADEAWCTPSIKKGEGKAGKSSLTFALGATDAARSTVITLTTSGSIGGIPLTKTATITVKQTGDAPVGDELYREICGTTVAKVDDRWPNVDTFTGWTRGGSLDQSGVKYGGNKASVRNSGKDYDPSEAEKAEVSGAPYSYINASQGLDITDINVASNTNFTFTFTAQATVSTLAASPFTPTFGDITASMFKFYASADGTTFSPVAFSTTKIAAGSWYLCKAEFKLPAGATGSKVAVRFDTYTGGASLRLDDFKLFEGGNGAELGGGTPGDEYQKVTINNLAVGKYEVEATIVGVHSQGVLFADNAGGTTNYVLGFDNTWTTQTSNPYIGKINTQATVKGTVADRSGMLQYAPFEVALGAKLDFALPAPVTFDAAGIEAYKAAVKYQYVQFTGTLDIVVGASYNTYTVAVAGSDAIVTLAYGLDSYFAGIVSGSPVNVKGFAIGYDTASKKLNIMTSEVTANTTTPVIAITTTPARFIAAGEAQTINFSKSNLGASDKVFAKIEGTDAAQFSIPAGEITGTSVVVTASANATSDAQAAKLIIYAATAETGVVLVAWDEVNLSQAGVSTGADTKGNYESMSQFVSSGSSTANPAGLAASKVGELPASGFKIGTGSKVGTFTSTAVGVAGSKKLGFYAVGWKGKTAELKITVNGGGTASVASVALTGTDDNGATGNAPFVALNFNDDTDYFVVTLTDLTAASTITFETTVAANGRAVVCGVQLF